jgi:hypothetical protein
MLIEKELVNIPVYYKHKYFAELSYGRAWRYLPVIATEAWPRVA